ncbi:hypothetical protein [Mycolicibacterium chlorophenolicum]|uniref:hypothetical protein n=1 Tax=Mycolicibacterium chlorophenolicum TaxID=37916 RepID=UPI00103C7D92|nr:hypothetical protein [Mycolicibacterium chlorophenolicum]
MMVRLCLGTIVLIPAAAFTFAVREPFAISAIASSTAIILHDPQRYHQRPQVILTCYAAGIVVSAAISLGGALVGLPGLLAAGIAAVVIVASPAGRIHPPTACIPLQVTASIAPLALLGRWLTFTGLSVACLAMLWLLTSQPLTRRRQVVVDHQDTPCTTAS